MSARNVLGEPLEPCSLDPLTGFFRDGCCHTGPNDTGRHVICARMTKRFLAYARDHGNDLSAPRPEAGFPGLAPGDRWCLCAARWREALEAGVAPPVVIGATEESALEVVSLAELKRHAIDLC
jgi:uncharacterized protein (DUF2237 family)